MKKKREEEVVEIAVVATGVALLVSVLKHLVPCVMKRFVPPSPFLFLLVHVVVVSIVCSSFCIHPSPTMTTSVAKRVKDGKVVDGDVEMRFQVEVVEIAEEEEDEEEDEEVNAKAEAFIAAFRRQLLFDDAKASGER
ncbi:hypothetical protein ZOSMA_235G00090 [Zostera marina]|uniref:Uncharacterized protein n=1 Tax=Zostera marina TaxID=29655 RepID=A0A0K9PHU7_ZOSMR|nr:hypothetical protein ZOSMA_235G00090 [Zostera marina]